MPPTLRPVILIATVALIIGGVFVGEDFLQERFFALRQLNQSEPVWQTYTSETFDFSVDVPSNWTIVEFPNDEIAPRVNMYPARYKRALSFIAEDGLEHMTPITHHSPVPQVSIFPHGIPTEGFFGEFTDSDVVFSEKIRVARDFVLEDGSRFAIFASFENVPESWNEAGFMWARADVKRFRARCFRGELRIKESKCDPLSGDTVVYYGNINTENRDIEKTILSSLRFVP